MCYTNSNYIILIILQSEEEERTMPLPKYQEYSTADIYSLPDGQRAELIDGQIYDMAPPTRRHQRIISELHYLIKDYIKKNGGTCDVYPAPFAVRLNDDDRTYVEPDISVICDPKKLDDAGCTGAPDWIIEVVSPSSTRIDYVKKLFKYRTAGVKEYWIVDPDKNRIMVYNFADDNMSEYTFSDTVKSGIYEDLKIDFSDVL